MTFESLFITHTIFTSSLPSAFGRMRTTYKRTHFGRVTDVKWRKYISGVYGFSNRIHWSLLPCTVRKIDLSFNSLKSVPNQTLPTASDFPFLTELNVESNQLSGNVSWSELPSALRVLNIRQNKLSGSVEWSSLPSCLMILDISKNKFTGRCELHGITSCPSRTKRKSEFF